MSSVMEPGPILGSLVAENDLSAKQYYIVELSGALQVDVCDAATDVAIGVLLNKPKAAEACRVYVGPGLVPAACDGTTDIAAGDYLGTNASGVLVKKATADYSVCARAVEAITTNGVEIHTVLWLGPAFFRTAGG